MIDESKVRKNITTSYQIQAILYRYAERYSSAEDAWANTPLRTQKWLQGNRYNLDDFSRRVEEELDWQSQTPKLVKRLEALGIRPDQSVEALVFLIQSYEEAKVEAVKSPSYDQAFRDKYPFLRKRKPRSFLQRTAYEFAFNHHLPAKPDPTKHWSYTIIVAITIFIWCLILFGAMIKLINDFWIAK